MKILIVSGFLGAGKTTFINHLVKTCPNDFAILENEFANQGIDKDILDNNKLNIWELTEGCICCSTNQDFVSSVLTIANSINPEYLIIEPTGVGILENIIESLKKVTYERIQLLQPVTILDAYSFDNFIKDYPEIYQNQILTSKHVIFSKTDIEDPLVIEDISKKIKQLDPGIKIISQNYKNQDKSWWQQILNTDLDGTYHQQVETIDLETFAISDPEILGPNHLIYLLENIIRERYGKIIRAKGVIKAGNSHLRFDVVDKTYSITGCDSSIDSKIVFIGKEIRRNNIRKLVVKNYIKKINISK